MTADDDDSVLPSEPVRRQAPLWDIRCRRCRYRDRTPERICANIGEHSGNNIAPAKQRICYCRVSSANQKDDLQRQVHLMQQQFPDHCASSPMLHPESGIRKRKGLRSSFWSSRPKEWCQKLWLPTGTGCAASPLTSWSGSFASMESNSWFSIKAWSPTVCILRTVCRARRGPPGHH